MLLPHYGLPLTVLSLDGEEFQKQVLITDEVYVEWTTFCHYIAKEDMSSQIKCLNQCSPIACLGRCLHVTSSWDSISGEKLYKNENDKIKRLSEKSLSYLMKISIKSPQKLTDEDLEMTIARNME